MVRKLRMSKISLIRTKPEDRCSTSNIKDTMRIDNKITEAIRRFIRGSKQRLHSEKYNIAENSTWEKGAADRMPYTHAIPTTDVVTNPRAALRNSLIKA